LVLYSNYCCKYYYSLTYSILCSLRNVTPWSWLWWVAKTCRSKKNCCAVVGNKNLHALTSFQCSASSTDYNVSYYYYTIKIKILIGILFPREGDRISCVLLLLFVTVASVTGWKWRQVYKIVVLGYTDAEDILCQKCLNIVDEEVASSHCC
jgi:hypothetical protein